MSRKKKSAMQRLFERAQPGSSGGVRAHIQRAEWIQEQVRNRFGMDSPYQLRAKHLRWILHRATEDMEPATRYEYWLTCRVIARAIGRWDQWEPHLRGSWMRPTGRSGPLGHGRPPRVAGRR